MQSSPVAMVSRNLNILCVSYMDSILVLGLFSGELTTNFETSTTTHFSISKCICCASSILRSFTFKLLHL
uniref:Putative ovule protein n=1 Tax=Solanum chacoense TaxID=4108 RepID=A0A0V0HCJ9_SOLCH